ncbi:MAG: hypothetical protein ACREJP_08670, partial [Candidatus Methylomirabilales bacterium]
MRRGRRRAVTLAMVLGSLAMIGYRLFNLDLAGFIHDEPLMLTAAGRQLETGEWLSASPLVGNLGVRYGPSVFWFYGGVQLLFGPGAATSTLAMGLLLTGAHVALAAALSRAFRGGWLLFATLLAWIASSPYQFFWSRLAWDQLANVAASLALVILARAKFGWERAALLGIVLGLGLSSHLMIVPFAAVVLLVLVIEHRRSLSALTSGPGAVVLALVLVNLPYLLTLLKNPPPPVPFTGFSGSAFLGQMVGPARVNTHWGIDYFFDGAWGDFRSWLGGLSFLSVGGRVLVLVSIALSLLGLVMGLRSGEDRRRRIALIGILTWLSYAIFYAFRPLG